MTLKEKADEIRGRVSIPSYFYNIIVPNISDYYVNYPVDFDNKPVVCCPLHDEETPSMRYYEETNSFYCFGCSVGGDVINLHMKFMEKLNGEVQGYEVSVNFLYDYFIKGKESAGQKLRVDKKEELVSTNTEMIRYMRYNDMLEGQILQDRKLGLDIKVKLWEIMDLVEELVRKNELNAIEGMNYVKGKVKELII